MQDKWNVSNNQIRQERIVKYIRVSISSILAVGGAILLISQLIPLGDSYLKGKVLETKAENITSPVPGAYRREIGGEFAYWDPSSSYFENLLREASIIDQTRLQTYDPSTNTYRDVVIDETYSNSMSMTIDSLGIDSVNVSSNVESYDENIYNSALKNGLAHFKGTSLPGDGGNSFIYGHSAVDSYFSSHQDNPETIFTRLEDIEIGDEVIINKDGIDYTYIVRKKKIVEPSDFSVVGVQNTKEIITLMTCSPAGIGTKRLIVTADRIE